VACYGSGTLYSGKAAFDRDLSLNIQNIYIHLSDDILDTGRTLHIIKGYLIGMNPKDIKTCVLLDKPQRRKILFQVDFVGFQVPDRFIVGYGLDFNGLYRELPYIALLPEKEKPR
jgi:hypoxanthine phosphoribosyltransferase